MSIHDRFSASDLAAEVAPIVRKLLGGVRRVAIQFTRGVLWQLEGHGTVGERLKAEVFSGIGFYARPPEGRRAEAITLNVGGPRHPVIVATREEQTRAEVAGALEPDESAMYNSQAMVYVRGNGTIEARSKGGAAVALATKADIDALRSWLATHAHTGVSTGVGTSAGPASVPPAATGTTKFRAE